MPLFWKINNMNVLFVTVAFINPFSSSAVVTATAETGTVVYFVNATPCINKPSADCPLYIPEKSANYVIETKAGFDVKLGERIIFNST